MTEAEVRAQFAADIASARAAGEVVGGPSMTQLAYSNLLAKPAGTDVFGFGPGGFTPGLPPPPPVISNGGRQTVATERTLLPFVTETTPEVITPGQIIGRQEAAVPAIVAGAAGAIGKALLGAALVPLGGSIAEAAADYFGLGVYGREGAVGAGRTTAGTGYMAAGTFRAWDPVQQGYYGILPIQGQALQGITFAPGMPIPGVGTITKAWQTHTTRKDFSLATTQFAMTADGRMHSLSESGIMKSWRPYRSIVIGKTLTTANVRRVARRIKSHTRSLKKVLSCLK